MKLTSTKLKVVLILTNFVYMGCKQLNNQGTAGDPLFENGPVPLETFISCTVDQVGENYVLSCPNGTEITLQDGKDGVDGVNGTDGGSCHVSAVDEGALVYCDDGSAVVVKHGEDGSSCSVHELDAGAYVECDDGTSALVKNGADGQDGADGADGADGQDAQQSAYLITEVINPCGEQPLDEVILRFASGDLMAHYSHGSKQHFVILEPGKYVTTDKYKCKFTVTEDLEVTW